MSTKPRQKSPTQRCLAELRAMGATAEVVEKRLPIPGKFVTQDLFGFLDIVALLGPNIIGIQCTSWANHAARKTKILAEPRAKKWLAAGGLIELWSYRKSRTSGHWECRKEAIVAEDWLPAEAEDQGHEAPGTAGKAWHIGAHYVLED